jgi:hypothetical protein
MTAATAYAEISAAWSACRHVQDHVPWPAAGGIKVHQAWRTLYDLTAPYAGGKIAWAEDLEAIRAAHADLAGKVRRYCGDAAAAIVSNGTGQVAA